MSKKPNNEIVIYTGGNGRPAIQVRIEGENVWLTQAQLAELFHTTKQNISLHIQNIYEEAELLREATVKEYLIVQNVGIKHHFSYVRQTYRLRVH